MLFRSVWFFCLAFGAKALSRYVSRPAFWKVLDTVIAVIMFALAISLVFMPLGE